MSEIKNDNKNSDHDWRNQRLVDIFTVVAVLAIMIAGYHMLTVPAAPTQTSYIVPSQHVHW
jgi:hypothetical protein